MDAIAIWVRDDGEWTIIHRCRRCGKLVANRVAGDDDGRALREIAARPAAATSAIGREPSGPAECGSGIRR